MPYVRPDMLIRLIMRALCRGAYQQYVRYCSTDALLPPHLRRRCLLLVISEVLFYVCNQGDLTEEFNARQSGSIFNHSSDQFSDLLLSLTDSSNIFLDKTGHILLYTHIHPVSLLGTHRPPSHLDIRSLKEFSKVWNTTPFVFLCFLKKIHFHSLWLIMSRELRKNVWRSTKRRWKNFIHHDLQRVLCCVE